MAEALLSDTNWMDKWEIVIIEKVKQIEKRNKETKR